MPSESSAKEAGRNQRIGRYEIIRYIATGGMGAVYKARDTTSGKEIALKVLPPDIAVKPGMLERFQQEAIHASKLRHEHIVTLYEYGEANHIHFLAMELIEGIDLHEYVSRKGPLGPDEARVIIAQAAQALEHAHEGGIIHRDIKPSNFLITRNKGRLWVKLTDFGLAREVNDDEFRVTRAGSTVGTVDYMAPEQARDSRATDQRSDIYSLGCTLYFMLSGRPPFHEGGLTERILLHAEAEPVDICKLNPHVPQTLAALLQRMLAKKPANRYQTAAALLEDLERLRSGEGPRHMEVFTMMEELEDSGTGRRRAGTMAVAERGDPSPCVESQRFSSRKPESSTRRRHKQDPDTEEAVLSNTQAVPVVPRQRRVRQLLFVATPLLVLLATLGSVLTWWLMSRVAGAPRTDTPPEPVQVGRVEATNDPAPEIKPGPQPLGKSEPPKLDTKPSPIKPEPPSVEVKPVPVKPEPPRNPNEAPRLYQSPLPSQVEILRQEFNKPWAQVPVSPAGPVTLHVSRAFVTGGGQRFTSLAEALAAAPANQETVIELQDNGPLFESALAVQNRSVVLRAARGYRPLLAWDRARAGTVRPAAFLSVTGGHLTLENLDFVHNRDESREGEDLVLCRVIGGDLSARGCTFSVAGRSGAPVTMVQLERQASGAGVAAPPRLRCRLSGCYLRGADSVALDVRTPGVDVSLEDALIVGGSRPLLLVAGQSGPAPTVLRVLRSTLVAAQTILRIRPHTPADLHPQVYWTGWDTLLSRCSSELGGEMVMLADGASGNGMQWQATNCLYAGWHTLLGGREQLSAAALTAWQTRWQRTDGDRTVRETWPAQSSTTPWEDPPEAYRTTGSHVWYAGTAGAEVLGCNLAVLPPVRDAWHTLTFGRVVAAPFLMAPDLTAPEIPAATDGYYPGERLNLNEIDLGEHLEKVQQRMRLGPQVVLHLTGSGDRPTSPLRVKGVNLVLWCEPSQAGAEPLVLTFKGKGHPAALIEVEDGNLELLGVSMKLVNNNFPPHPRHLIQVRGGDLRVSGCNLRGPLSRAPKTFEGLIGFEGSGNPSAAQARDCGIADSILASGNSCIHSMGVGARVRVKNSMLVAAHDAVSFDPGPQVQARLNSQCFLEFCTVAARRSVVRLRDAPNLLPLEPFLLQARGNAFLDPFVAVTSVGATFEAALVAYDGDAFARGLLMWQGDDNGYDKRLPWSVAATNPSGDRPCQGQNVWSRLWGPWGDRNALALDLQKRTFDVDQLPLRLLALPPSARTRGNEPLGADLYKLRILRKPEKPKTMPVGP